MLNLITIKNPVKSIPFHPFEKTEFGHTDNENLLLIAQIAKTSSVSGTENRLK